MAGLRVKGVAGCEMWDRGTGGDSGRTAVLGEFQALSAGMKGPF